MTHEKKDTMKAVIYEGKPFNMVVKDVPKPRITSKGEAIVQVTTAAICGSDLHIYHGVLGSTNPPWSMGHEAMGIVLEIGSDVFTIKVGDRVIIPDIPDDGHMNVEPTSISDLELFGVGPDFGNLGGCQAEYVRVPFADQSLIPIPTSPSRELDYIFISDIWSTAWACLDFSGFQPGDTVAIFGAGPVGLLCAYSAILRGAAKVYSVDHVQSRLDKAASIGAIPINFTHSNAAKQILELEPDGVTRSCDCVGYECVNEDLKPQENAVITNAVNVTASGGGIGVIGVYLAQTDAPGRPRADTIAPYISFPMTTFWGKNLSMRSGTVDPKLYAARLVELVKSGRAKPSFIVSSEIDIKNAPEAYRRFDRHQETKVVIRFPEARVETSNGNGAIAETADGERSSKRRKRNA